VSNRAASNRYAVESCTDQLPEGPNVKLDRERLKRPSLAKYAVWKSAFSYHFT
jgi:hypothetical protein